ncbi:MAG: hypothetical protein Q8941_10270 [Bacteroidota bacterium]|nr:hypothetical protein [Bacteroidota bacterium]
MQFEKFDDKIKQAAEQHHPNYDETAWVKMEKLLDRHLPQENDRRRRIIFILLLSLLVGGGIWISVNRFGQQEKTVSANKNSVPEKTTAPSSSGPAKDVTEAAPGDLGTKQINKQPAIENSLATGSGDGNSIVTESSKPVKNSKIFSGKKQLRDDSYEAEIGEGKIAGVTKPGKNIVNPDKVQKADNGSENITISSPLANDKNEKTQPGNKDKDQADIVTKGDKANDKSVAPVKDVMDQHPSTTDEKNPAKKSPGKKGNVFFLSASAGPDISSVAMNGPGKIKVVGGAGFGYIFHGKWTLRTGFYTARKVYSADKESYKPKGVVIPNYQYLDKINADCKVYEIPLSLAYNFAGSEKGNWYASTGLSSYIMKKEVYDYVYQYPGAPPTVYSKTLNNENKHYLSVLSLSAGYQRKINNTLSVAAEPYIRVPLTGIGFGNVQLNSAGVLFSLNLSLFQPASRK